MTFEIFDSTFFADGTSAPKTYFWPVRNVLKLTCSKEELQKFPGVVAPDPHSTGGKREVRISYNPHLPGKKPRSATGVS